MLIPSAPIRFIAVLALTVVAGCSQATDPASEGGGERTQAPAKSHAAVRVDDVVPVTVLRASWGSGPTELGRRLPSEGSPEGPMSFAVDSDGVVYVLDQVNARVLVSARDGATRTIALPRESFQDIDLNGRGGVVVLDRFVDPSVVFFDGDGNETSRVAIPDAWIANPGSVTALELHEDGAWLEIEHARWVRVADVEGNPASEREVEPGRRSADGRSWIRAWKSKPDGVGIVATPVAPAGSLPTLQNRYSFSMDVLHLVAVESDRAGRIWLVAELATWSRVPPYEATGRGREALAVSSSGGLVDRIALDAPVGPEEQLRPVRMGRDGALYELSCELDGAVLRRVAR